MPSIKTTTPILPGKYYHIFNRGSNKKAIFYSTANYHYFLKLIDKNLHKHVDILAYCLLFNHFHLIIRTKDLNNENESGYRKRITSHFKSLFVSYAMSINKQEGFVSNLFDAKFKRLEINNDNYLKYLIFYTHYNPKKHQLCTDFKNYLFSSYNSLISNTKTKVNRELVLNIFEGREQFINYHDVLHQERNKLILE
ncbi:transposase [Carboxylicivirga caseinilyticus]|uniref:transposase n=1 Tax=Carboxylicivirga caseinilyticus TaxID=3417572 RepID=UPI003D34F132|nr:hypothetical protein [Marinilabiliaceae bacterium A049]